MALIGSGGRERLDPRSVHAEVLAQHMCPGELWATYSPVSEQARILAEDYRRRALAILDLLYDLGAYRPHSVLVPADGRTVECDPDPLPGVRIVVRWETSVHTQLLDPSLFAERFARHHCIDRMHHELVRHRREHREK